MTNDTDGYQAPSATLRLPARYAPATDLNDYRRISGKLERLVHGTGLAQEGSVRSTASRGGGKNAPVGIAPTGRDLVFAKLIVVPAKPPPRGSWVSGGVSALAVTMIRANAGLAEHLGTVGIEHRDAEGGTGGSRQAGGDRADLGLGVQVREQHLLQAVRGDAQQDLLLSQS